MLQTDTAIALVHVIKKLMDISRTDTNHSKGVLGEAQRVVTIHKKALDKIDPRSLPKLTEKKLYKSVNK